MGFFLVLKAEVVRNLIIMRRYWFATLTGMLMGYGIIVGLIVSLASGGGDELAQQVDDAEKATTWALGLIIGMFAFGIVGMFTQGLQSMARSGQLEQVCMSPHGLVTNFMARTTVSAVTSIATLTALLLAVTWTIGGRLHGDPVAIPIVLLLTYTNLIGFGFMAGGLVLVFKQTGKLAMIVRLVLLALAVKASSGVDEWPPVMQWIAHALPVTDGAFCLTYVLVKGQMVGAQVIDGELVGGEFQSVFLHPSFYYLIVSCILWTIIGVFLFKRMEDYSRDKGTLGAY